MEDMGIGAGLGAIGFWGFIAAVVVAGIWYDLRRKEARHETVRRLIESGQKLDDATLDKLMSAGSSGESENLARDLKVSGLIVIFVAPGLAVMAWFLGQLNENAFLPVLGAAFLVGFVGIGLLVAAKAAANGNSTNPNR